MSSFPNSPRLLKGGIALLNPQTGAVQRLLPCNTTRIRFGCRFYQIG
jgi:hypothetical protein